MLLKGGTLCGSLPFGVYELNHLRPEAAKDVFVHFTQKVQGAWRFLFFLRSAGLDGR